MDQLDSELSGNQLFSGKGEVLGDLSEMEFGDINARLIKAYDDNLDKMKQSGYKLFYVGVGNEDFVYEGVQLLRKKLNEHNFDYFYRETSGGHTWANWRVYLNTFGQLLFK